MKILFYLLVGISIALASDASTNKSCKITSQKLSGQVCDFTGKCLYAKRSTDFECVEVKQELIGYKSYVQKTSDGSLTIAPIYYENKNFKGQLVPAFAAAAQMDSTIHVFSGWSGMCEKGTFTDFSWTQDPMFWASMAMSAYSAAGSGAFGSTAQSTINNINSSFDSIASSAKEYASGVADSISSNLSTTTEAAASTAANTAADASAKLISETGSGLVGNGLGGADPNLYTPSFTERLKDMNMIKDLGYYQVTYTGLASAAAQMYAAASSQTTQQTATDLNFGAAGRASSNSSNNIAKAYNSCMSSLGLSYANQISYTAGASIDITGENIQKPWKNPLRMTTDNLQKLGLLVGQQFFEMSYMQTPPDNMGMVTVIALNSPAYLQAGQVLCGGYLNAAALNLQNTAAANAQAKQANRGDAMLNAGISGALGMLPPPYNMAASIAFKVLTSFSDGNACSNKEFAMSLSPLQFKTYMFKSNNPTQCHYIKEECAAKWYWGDCMRKREKYCCYDQISTRIFAESAYEQMNKSWNSCQGIDINEFKNINFRECRDGEAPQTNRCISQAKYQELEQALLIQMNKGIPVDNLVNQIKNAVGN